MCFFNVPPTRTIIVIITVFWVNPSPPSPNNKENNNKVKNQLISGPAEEGWCVCAVGAVTTAT